MIVGPDGEAPRTVPLLQLRQLCLNICLEQRTCGKPVNRASIRVTRLQSPKYEFQDSVLPKYLILPYGPSQKLCGALL